MIRALMIAFVASIGIASASADVPRFKVYVHREKGGAEISEEAFPFLVSPERFESASFKVVLNQSDVAIPTSVADPEVRLRAANVLFHMERAKKFFDEKLGFTEVRDMPPAILRIEVDRAYDPRDKFSKTEEQWNNAWSIPFGEGHGFETWFSKSKKIRIRDILKDLDQNPLRPEMRKIRRSLLDWQVDLGIRNGIGLATADGVSGRKVYLAGLASQLKSMVIAELVLQTLPWISRIVQPKYYYLDTALIPEVIYHEFAHLAFYAYMNNQLVMPVSEGIANFFAAQIIDDPKIGAKFKAASTARPRNGNEAATYTYDWEKREAPGTESAVFAFLWQLRDVIGVDKAQRLVLAVVRSGKITTGFTQVTELASELYTQLKAVNEKTPNELDGDLMGLGLYFESKKIPR